MRHKRRLTDKIKKCRKCLLNLWSLQYHVICNVRELLNLKRDWDLRIDKRTESIHDRPVRDFNRPDLYDPVFRRAESGCLNIKYNKRVIQCLSLFVDSDLCQVVYKICFHPIYDLKWILLVKSFHIMIGIREGLHYAMVRNGDRLMSPVMCPRHKRLRLRYSVHITHFRVAVKLHTLLWAGILPRCRKVTDLTDTHNGTDRQLSIKLINRRHSFDLQKSAFFDSCENLRKLFISREHLYHDRIREICDCKHDDRLLISNLSCLQLQNLSADRNLSHLSDHIGKRNCLVLKIPSI